MDDVPEQVDVAVVGGGPGGYAAAIRAGQLGLDVAVIERDAMGGTCLNRGCIPSKAVLSATGVAERAARADDMGVRADPTVDVAAMTDWTDGVVARLVRGVEALCERAGATVIDGTGRFEGPGELRVESDDGTATLAFDAAVVATGSRPATLPGFDLADEPVWSSRDALAVESAPDRLVVVGAGYVGLELSTAFARLGTEVEVLEVLDRPLPGFETDLARPVRRAAERRGIDFHFEHGATGWQRDDEDVVVTAEDDAGEEVTVRGDAVLVAVGREPVTEGLDLDAVGLETDDRGFLATDDRGRTSVEGVYAVGDVSGEPLLAHAAFAEGAVAAETIAGRDATTADRAIPRAVFTQPAVADVGLTEDGAAEAGYDPVVGEFPFRASGRALTEGRREGFARVVADAETGRVLGGQVVGHEAPELIAEVGLAVETGATLADLAATVHAHPTLSEAVHEAAAAALGHSLHR